MVNTTRTLATGTFLRTAVNGRSRAAPSLGVESLKFRQKYCWPFFQKPFSSVILTFSTSASFGHWLAKLCWWWHCVLWRDEPASVLFEGREFRFLTSRLHPRPLFLEGGNIHGNITHCDADPFTCQPFLIVRGTLGHDRYLCIFYHQDPQFHTTLFSSPRQYVLELNPGAMRWNSDSDWIFLCFEVFCYLEAFKPSSWR